MRRRDVPRVAGSAALLVLVLVAPVFLSVPQTSIVTTAVWRVMIQRARWVDRRYSSAGSKVRMRMGQAAKEASVGVRPETR